MINYNNLASSIEHYTNYAFKQIDSPWTVTEEVLNSTGKGRTNLMLEGKGKGLVASGEQSFIYMLTKGYLPSGRYQTITPCFREEPYDFTHRKQFIKNELIVTDKVDLETLEEVVEIALTFFNTFFKEPCHKVFKEGEIDIEYNGFELGSYGIRGRMGHSWIYGTGCAEPRLSTLQNL